MIKLRSRSGFTLVELLIVIVVIAILAAITIVAYNGVQAKAQDSARASDMDTLQKALALYYTENSAYPSSASCGSTTINSAWCTTADSSWDTFATRLNEKGLIIGSVPRDPISAQGETVTSGAFDYAYFSYPYERCGAAAGQWYMLVYARAGDQVDHRDCSTGTIPSTYAKASEIIVHH